MAQILIKNEKTPLKKKKRVERENDDMTWTRLRRQKFIKGNQLLTKKKKFIDQRKGRG